MFTQYASAVPTQWLTSARHRYARSSRPSARPSWSVACSWLVSVWGSSSGNSSEPPAKRLTTASSPPLRTLSTLRLQLRSSTARDAIIWRLAVRSRSSRARERSGDVGPKIARTRHRSERCERSAGGRMEQAGVNCSTAETDPAVASSTGSEPPAQVSLGAQNFKTSATASQRHALRAQPPRNLT